MVPLQFNLTLSCLFEQVVLHNFLSPQLIAAMHERDFGGNITQVKRFLHGGIAAANNCDVLTAIEKAVAGSAG